jgi:hypothetical protein
MSDLLKLPDNPLRGEVSVEIAGETYRLVLDVPAFIYAQQATGMKMEELVTTFIDAGDDLLILRCLFWAGLQRNHAQPIEAAQDLLSTAGLAKIRLVVMAAVAAAVGFSAEGKKGPSPRRRGGKAGTG